MKPLQRILHVEDDVSIQEVARVALEIVGGFEVSSCDNGQAALSQAAEWQPDLILLDVMMPGIDGPTTLAKLREQASTQAIPVVFMTAKVQPSEIEHYRAIGGLDVVIKPFDPMTLAEQLREIWERSDVG
ncbi:response regulator [Salinicola rhizosphaerae]|uniref:Response regulator n=1 Tax=Salinicola rhizosphaerae TaxID=1443141 RepID=A0ABQ3E0Z4_9GAMM|nr:response regulator [Salinicola rhizosphaerae]GHB22577.1 response regulator [Salinicola rhizosphaerae]